MGGSTMLKFIMVLAVCVSNAMSVSIKKAAPPIEMGEGPHWDVRSQKLYYVNMIAQKIMRLDPATGKITSAYIKNGPVGVVVPVEGTHDKLIVGSGRDIVLVTWDGESDNPNPPIKKLAALDTDRKDTRVNDGKCDPAGRFWIGTMGLEVNRVVKSNRGSLYTFSEDSGLVTVLSPVSISNGLVWSLKKDTFYYIDSQTYQVSAFDYNLNTGEISNMRVIFDLKKNNIKGLPDGMTIDADGNLWVALFDGGAVIQVDPTHGKLLRTVKMPVKKITSVAFGGPNLDVLYVTSAYKDMTTKERKKKPNSGSLYTVKHLGVRGLPPSNFKYSS